MDDELVAWSGEERPIYRAACSGPEDWQVMREAIHAALDEGDGTEEEDGGRDTDVIEPTAAAPTGATDEPPSSSCQLVQTWTELKTSNFTDGIYLSKPELPLTHGKELEPASSLDMHGDLKFLTPDHQGFAVETTADYMKYPCFSDSLCPIKSNVTYFAVDDRLRTEKESRGRDCSIIGTPVAASTGVSEESSSSCCQQDPQQTWTELKTSIFTDIIYVSKEALPLRHGKELEPASSLDMHSALKFLSPDHQGTAAETTVDHMTYPCFLDSLCPIKSNVKVVAVNDGAKTGEEKGGRDSSVTEAPAAASTAVTEKSLPSSCQQTHQKGQGLDRSKVTDGTSVSKETLEMSDAEEPQPASSSDIHCPSEIFGPHHQGAHTQRKEMDSIKPCSPDGFIKLTVVDNAVDDGKQTEEERGLGDTSLIEIPSAASTGLIESSPLKHGQQALHQKGTELETSVLTAGTSTSKEVLEISGNKELEPASSLDMLRSPDIFSPDHQGTAAETTVDHMKYPCFSDSLCPVTSNMDDIAVDDGERTEGEKGGRDSSIIGTPAAVSTAVTEKSLPSSCQQTPQQKGQGLDRSNVTNGTSVSNETLEMSDAKEPQPASSSDIHCPSEVFGPHHQGAHTQRKEIDSIMPCSPDGFIKPTVVDNAVGDGKQTEEERGLGDTSLIETPSVASTGLIEMSPLKHGQQALHQKGTKLETSVLTDGTSTSKEVLGMSGNKELDPASSLDMFRSPKLFSPDHQGTAAEMTVDHMKYPCFSDSLCPITSNVDDIAVDDGERTEGEKVGRDSSTIGTPAAVSTAVTEKSLPISCQQTPQQKGQGLDGSNVTDGTSVSKETLEMSNAKEPQPASSSDMHCPSEVFGPHHQGAHTQRKEIDSIKPCSPDGFIKPIVVDNAVGDGKQTEEERGLGDISLIETPSAASTGLIEMSPLKHGQQALHQKGIELETSVLTDAMSTSKEVLEMSGNKELEPASSLDMTSPPKVFPPENQGTAPETKVVDLIKRLCFPDRLCPIKSNVAHLPKLGCGEEFKVSAVAEPFLKMGGSMVYLPSLIDLSPDNQMKGEATIPSAAPVLQQSDGNSSQRISKGDVLPCKGISPRKAPEEPVSACVSQQMLLPVAEYEEEKNHQTQKVDNNISDVKVPDIDQEGGSIGALSEMETLEGKGKTFLSLKTTGSPRKAGRPYKKKTLMKMAKLLAIAQDCESETTEISHVNHHPDISPPKHEVQNQKKTNKVIKSCTTDNASTEQSPFASTSNSTVNKIEDHLVHGYDKPNSPSPSTHITDPIPIPSDTTSTSPSAGPHLAFGCEGHMQQPRKRGRAPKSKLKPQEVTKMVQNVPQVPALTEEAMFTPDTVHSTAQSALKMTRKPKKRMKRKAVEFRAEQNGHTLITCNTTQPLNNAALTPQETWRVPFSQVEAGDVASDVGQPPKVNGRGSVKNVSKKKSSEVKKQTQTVTTGSGLRNEMQSHKESQESKQKKKKKGKAINSSTPSNLSTKQSLTGSSTSNSTVSEKEDFLVNNLDEPVSSSPSTHTNDPIPILVDTISTSAAVGPQGQTQQPQKRRRAPKNKLKPREVKVKPQGDQETPREPAQTALFISEIIHSTPQILQKKQKKPRKRKEVECKEENGQTLLSCSTPQPGNSLVTVMQTEVGDKTSDVVQTPKAKKGGRAKKCSKQETNYVKVLAISEPVLSDIQSPQNTVKKQRKPRKRKAAELKEIGLTLISHNIIQASSNSSSQEELRLPVSQAEQSDGAPDALQTPKAHGRGHPMNVYTKETIYVKATGALQDTTLSEDAITISEPILSGVHSPQNAVKKQKKPRKRKTAALKEENGPTLISHSTTESSNFSSQEELHLPVSQAQESDASQTPKAHGRGRPKKVSKKETTDVKAPSALQDPMLSEDAISISGVQSPQNTSKKPKKPRKKKTVEPKEENGLTLISDITVQPHSNSSSQEELHLPVFEAQQSAGAPDALQTPKAHGRGRPKKVSKKETVDVKATGALQDPTLSEDAISPSEPIRSGVQSPQNTLKKPKTPRKKKTVEPKEENGPTLISHRPHSKSSSQEELHLPVCQAQQSDEAPDAFQTPKPPDVFQTPKPHGRGRPKKVSKKETVDVKATGALQDPTLSEDAISPSEPVLSGVQSPQNTLKKPKKPRKKKTVEPKEENGPTLISHRPHSKSSSQEELHLPVCQAQQSDEAPDAFQTPKPHGRGRPKKVSKKETVDVKDTGALQDPTLSEDAISPSGPVLSGVQSPQNTLKKPKKPRKKKTVEPREENGQTLISHSTTESSSIFSSQEDLHLPVSQAQQSDALQTPKAHGHGRPKKVSKKETIDVKAASAPLDPALTKDIVTISEPVLSGIQSPQNAVKKQKKPRKRKMALKEENGPMPSQSIIQPSSSFSSQEELHLAVSQAEQSNGAPNVLQTPKAHGRGRPKKISKKETIDAETPSVSQDPMLSEDVITISEPILSGFQSKLNAVKKLKKPQKKKTIEPKEENGPTFISHSTIQPHSNSSSQEELNPQVRQSDEASDIKTPKSPKHSRAKKVLKNIGVKETSDIKAMSVPLDPAMTDKASVISEPVLSDVQRPQNAVKRQKKARKRKAVELKEENRQSLISHSTTESSSSFSSQEELHLPVSQTQQSDGDSDALQTPKAHGRGCLRKVSKKETIDVEAPSVSQDPALIEDTITISKPVLSSDQSPQNTLKKQKKPRKNKSVEAKEENCPISHSTNQSCSSFSSQEELHLPVSQAVQSDVASEVLKTPKTPKCGHTKKVSTKETIDVKAMSIPQEPTLSENAISISETALPGVQSPQNTLKKQKIPRKRKAVELKEENGLTLSHSTTESSSSFSSQEELHLPVSQAQQSDGAPDALQTPKAHGRGRPKKVSQKEIVDVKAPSALQDPKLSEDDISISEPILSGIQSPQNAVKKQKKPRKKKAVEPKEENGSTFISHSTIQPHNNSSSQEELNSQARQSDEASDMKTPKTTKRNHTKKVLKKENMDVKETSGIKVTSVPLTAEAPVISEPSEVLQTPKAHGCGRPRKVSKKETIDVEAPSAPQEPALIEDTINISETILSSDQSPQNTLKKQKKPRKKKMVQPKEEIGSISHSTIQSPSSVSSPQEVFQSPVPQTEAGDIPSDVVKTPKVKKPGCVKKVSKMETDVKEPVQTSTTGSDSSRNTQSHNGLQGEKQQLSEIKTEPDYINVTGTKAVKNNIKKPRKRRLARKKAMKSVKRELIAQASGAGEHIETKEELTKGKSIGAAVTIKRKPGRPFKKKTLMKMAKLLAIAPKWGSNSTENGMIEDVQKLHHDSNPLHPLQTKVKKEQTPSKAPVSPSRKSSRTGKTTSSSAVEKDDPTYKPEEAILPSSGFTECPIQPEDMDFPSLSTASTLAVNEVKVSESEGQGGFEQQTHRRGKSPKKPATPIKKPTTPVKKTTTKVKKPATPVKKTTMPVKKPTTQVKKPTMPVNKPTSPIKKPSSLVKKTILPVKKPTSPVKKPTRPVKTQNDTAPPVIPPTLIVEALSQSEAVPTAGNTSQKTPKKMKKLKNPASKRKGKVGPNTSGLTELQNDETSLQEELRVPNNDDATKVSNANVEPVGPNSPSSFLHKPCEHDGESKVEGEEQIVLTGSVFQLEPMSTDAAQQPVLLPPEIKNESDISTVALKKNSKKSKKKKMISKPHSEDVAGTSMQISDPSTSLATGVEVGLKATHVLGVKRKAGRPFKKKTLMKMAKVLAIAHEWGAGAAEQHAFNQANIVHLPQDLLPGSKVNKENASKRPVSYLPVSNLRRSSRTSTLTPSPPGGKMQEQLEQPLLSPASDLTITPSIREEPGPATQTDSSTPPQGHESISEVTSPVKAEPRKRGRSPKGKGKPQTINEQKALESLAALAQEMVPENVESPQNIFTAQKGKKKKSSPSKVDVMKSPSELSQSLLHNRNTTVPEHVELPATEDEKGFISSADVSSFTLNQTTPVILKPRKSGRLPKGKNMPTVIPPSASINDQLGSDVSHGTPLQSEMKIQETPSLCITNKSGEGKKRKLDSKTMLQESDKIVDAEKVDPDVNSMISQVGSESQDSNAEVSKGVQSIGQKRRKMVQGELTVATSLVEQESAMEATAGLKAKARKLKRKVGLVSKKTTSIQEAKRLSHASSTVEKLTENSHEDQKSVLEHSEKKVQTLSKKAKMHQSFPLETVLRRSSRACRITSGSALSKVEARPSAESILSVAGLSLLPDSTLSKPTVSAVPEESEITTDSSNISQAATKPTGIAAQELEKPGSTIVTTEMTPAIQEVHIVPAAVPSRKTHRKVLKGRRRRRKTWWDERGKPKGFATKTKCNDALELSLQSSIDNAGLYSNASLCKAFTGKETGEEMSFINQLSGGDNLDTEPSDYLEPTTELCPSLESKVQEKEDNISSDDMAFINPFEEQAAAWQAAKDRMLSSEMTKYVFTDALPTQASFSIGFVPQVPLPQLQKIDRFTQYYDTDPVETLIEETCPVACPIKPGEKVRLPKTKVRKPIECRYCGRSFRHISAFTIHQRIHTGEKPYRCLCCGKSFAQLYKLKSHRETHHLPRSLQCPCCSKRFAERDELVSHFKLHIQETKHLSLNDETGPEILREPDAPSADSSASPKDVNRLKCMVCSKDFLSKLKLKIHMRTHKEEKPFSCKDCGKKFKKSSSVVVHEKTHWPVKPYACSVCGKGFNQLRALKTHSLQHTGETPFSCSHCGHAFSELPALRKHQASRICSTKKNGDADKGDIAGFLVHQGVDGQVNTPVFFKCQVCRQLYRQWCQYTLHLRTHTRARPYLCDTCGQSYDRDSEVGVHCMVCCRSSGEQMVCSAPLSEIWKNPETQHNFQAHPDPLHNSQNDPDSLQNSQAHPDPLQNSQNDPDSLQNSQAHPDSLQNSQTPPDSTFPAQQQPSPSNDQQSQCRDHSLSELEIMGQESADAQTERLDSGQCLVRAGGQSSPTHSIYSSPTSPSHSIISLTSSIESLDCFVVSSDDESSQSLLGRFQCPQCDLHFRQYRTFRAHMQTHAPVHRYACGHCGQTFARWNRLWLHQRLHRRKRRVFPCAQCSLQFRFFGSYKEHMQYHAQQRPYACPLCPQTFILEETLNAHQCECHGPREALKCDVCGKAFSNLINLERHALLHNGAISHYCLLCNLSFTSNRALQEHLKTHNNWLSVPLPELPSEPLSFPHQCKRCKASFTSGDLLYAHQICHSTGGKPPVRPAAADAADSHASEETPQLEKETTSISSVPKPRLDPSSVPDDDSLYVYPHPDTLYVVPGCSLSRPQVINLDSDEDEVPRDTLSTSQTIPNTDPPSNSGTSQTIPNTDPPSISRTSQTIPNTDPLSISAPSALEEQDSAHNVSSVTHLPQAWSGPEIIVYTDSEPPDSSRDLEDSFECADCCARLSSVSELHEHYLQHALGTALKI